MDAKALYAILATFADYKTGETFVSNERLQIETGFGRDKVKELLRELAKAGFISRRRRLRKNLKAERYIRCLKHVCSTDGKSAYRRDGRVFGTHENQTSILTPVKSSVTPEKQEESSFPHAGEIPERIM
jgi:Helix-turn-helix domain